MSDPAVVFSPTTITAGSTLIKAGLALSAIPSIAGINSSSDWNQIIGLVNRRTSQVWPAMGSFSYLSQGEMPTASLVNSLRTRINTIRNGVNVGSFNFGTAAAAGNRIKATEFTALRTALNFAGSRNLGGSGGMRAWFRNDNPYGTEQSESIIVSTIVGKWSGSPSSGDPSDRPITRWRTMTNFFQPAGLSPNYVTTLLIQIYSWTNSLEPWTFQIWSSATDDSAYASTSVAYNLNFLEATIPYGSTGDQIVPVDAGRVAAKIGARWSIIMGSNTELANSGAGGTGSSTDRAAAQVSDPVTSGVRCVLILDWGF